MALTIQAQVDMTLSKVTVNQLLIRLAMVVSISRLQRRV